MLPPGLGKDGRRPQALIGSKRPVLGERYSATGFGSPNDWLQWRDKGSMESLINRFLLVGDEINAIDGEVMPLPPVMLALGRCPCLPIQLRWRGQQANGHGISLQFVTHLLALCNTRVRGSLTLPHLIVRRHRLIHMRNKPVEARRP